MIDSPVPLIGFAAWSGTGKTTLIAELIPLLNAEGLRVAIIKHAHHNFEPDQRGKDSYKLREAGADQVLLTSGQRWAIFADRPEPKSPDLAEELARLSLDGIDLVIVEGFKHCPFTKIELHRPKLGKPLLYPDDPNIIAIASDAPLPDDAPETRFDLNQPAQIAAFLINTLRQTPRSQP